MKKEKSNLKKGMIKGMEENAVLEAKATLRYARISARKVKIVADLIRGKDVSEALDPHLGQ